MKYKDNMTPEEQALLLKEIEELDKAYWLAVDVHNRPPVYEDEEEWEDEVTSVHKAALNMGRP